MGGEAARPGEGLGRFLLTSFLAGGLLGALAFAVFDARGVVVIAATAAGFCVSTVGWLIVWRGFGDEPGRITGYFAAALLVKLVLLGIVAAGVVVVGVAPREFLAPFVTVFFPVGFLQLTLTVRMAGRLERGD